MQSAQSDTSRRAHDWFLEALAVSGRKKSDIAEILGLSNSAITRLTTGNQPLKADQMLILSEELKHPLPQTRKHMTDFTPDSNNSFPKELFKRAYDQVMIMEKQKPEHERMDTYSMLDTVFYVLQAILATHEKTHRILHE